MRRVLSLWFPHLPLDRFIRKEDPRVGGPFAIIAEEKNAWRITYANEHALSAGVAAGQSLPDARAICPWLLSEPADPMREIALLRALRRWADRLSPVVAMSPPDMLHLDISGVAHLFGGEALMAHYAVQKLSDTGLSARAGIADTRAAALALARYGAFSPAIAQPGETYSALCALPVEALGCELKFIHELRRTGFKTLGQIFEISASDLARRYGLEVSRSRAVILGHVPDPVSSTALDPVYGARMSLPEPIGLTSDLEAVLTRLARRVCEKLQFQGKGARRFCLTVRCVDSGDHHLAVGFARPCVEPDHVLQQFAHPLGELKIRYGADWFRLSAEQIEPLHPRQLELHTAADDTGAVGQIISTIGNRIGFDRVHRFIPQDSHLPEYAFTSVEAVTSEAHPEWQEHKQALPVLLLNPPLSVEVIEHGRPPKKFRVFRQTFTCADVSGPDRISSEWWRGDAQGLRDYWSVQTQDGPRFWLLNYPGVKPVRWYLAGRFA